MRKGSVRDILGTSLSNFFFGVKKLIGISAANDLFAVHDSTDGFNDDGNGNLTPIFNEISRKNHEHTRIYRETQDVTGSVSIDEYGNVLLTPQENGNVQSTGVSHYHSGGTNYQLEANWNGKNPWTNYFGQAHLRIASRITSSDARSLADIGADKVLITSDELNLSNIPTGTGNALLIDSNGQVFKGDEGGSTPNDAGLNGVIKVPFTGGGVIAVDIPNGVLLEKITFNLTSSYASTVINIPGIVSASSAQPGIFSYDIFGEYETGATITSDAVNADVAGTAYFHISKLIVQ